MPDNNTAEATPGTEPELACEKLADLCAVGVMPIPDDLPENEQRRLLIAISQRRRKRLLHLFASAIADDIWRDWQATGKARC